MKQSEHIALHDFEVVLNESVAADCMRMLIRAPELASLLEPGQFMNIEVPGQDAHILRAPLSFAYADREAGTVELIYNVVGTGTRTLAAMQEGQTSTVVGPCGHGWRLPQEEGRVLLVAGGVGFPPIVAAARMLQEAGYACDCVVGAQTKDKLSFGGLAAAEEICTSASDAAGTPGELFVCTDDGSYGIAGFTTVTAERLLDERDYCAVYTCGPAPMMAGVAALAAQHKVACQASLERMMGCGFGACNTCNVALVGGGYASCCTDGPVFDASEVVW